MLDEYNSVEDFLADESFQRYCLRQSDLDIQLWKDYQKKYPHKKELIDEAKALVCILTVRETTTKEELSIFKNRFYRENEYLLDRNTSDGKVRSVRFKKILWTSVAASLFLIAGVAYKFFAEKKPEHAVAVTMLPHITTTPKAQKKYITLPDGSKVWLNAQSSLTMRNEFNELTREIDLIGEAYFEIAHNPSKPFIVHTASMNIKVLGTKFNVSAYQEDKKATATLISGSIEATLTNNPRMVYKLQPGEKLAIANNLNTEKEYTVQAQALKLQVVNVDKPQNEILWTNRGLEIEDQHFEEIAVRLERQYGVTIIFKEEEVKKNIYTATFENETVEEILQALQKVLPFTYTKESKTGYIISK